MIRENYPNIGMAIDPNKASPGKQASTTVCQTPIRSHCLSLSLDLALALCNDLSGIGTQLKKDGVLQLVAFLRSAESPYVRNFESWATQITEGLLEEILLGVVDLIRLIQLHSEFYNSRISITGMYSKVSQAVMLRCEAYIDMDQTFETDVTEAKVKLNQCIACCESWKQVYEEREIAHRKGNPTANWGVNTDSVFADVDAFIHRCKDLLDVCTCLAQFCFKDGTIEAKPPAVRGTHFKLLQRGIEQVTINFKDVLVTPRREAGSHILFNSMWKDAYYKFRKSTEKLDLTIQGIIATAFKNVSRMPVGLELIEVFEPFNTRDLIRRSLSTCTLKICHMVYEQTTLIKSIFNENRNNASVRTNSPDWSMFAGGAAWAKCLHTQADQMINSYEVAKPYLIMLVTDGTELESAKILREALQEYCAKTYRSWYSNVFGDLNAMLFVPLMRRGKNRALLELNFDKVLLTTYQEIALFHRLGFDIPQSANDVYMKREDMRLLREHVLLVLRDYNRIILMLTEEERQLFRERIRFLDKKVQPGLAKLTWASPGIKDLYVADTRKHSFALAETVTKYLATNRQIARGCHRLSMTQLVKIDPRRTYRGSEFSAAQEGAQDYAKEELRQMHRRIINFLKTSYQVFRNDGPEVQTHWARYTVKIDQMVEDSLKVCVKKALVALSTIVNGDVKTDPNPSFRMDVVLDSTTVELEPSYKTLVVAIMKLASNVSNVCAGLARLPKLLARNVQPRNNYNEIFDADDECRKVLNALHQGMLTNEPNVQAFVSTWVEKYSTIWNTDKDKFIERYTMANPPLNKFDADISRYDELANNAEQKDNIVGVEFLLFDNQSLKFLIVEHCRIWREKLTSLLLDNAKNDMIVLCKELADITTKLGKVPETLDEMCNTIELLDGTNASLDATGERRVPINEQFDILAKHDVEIDEETIADLDGLPTEWDAFKEFLVGTAENLEVSRKQFKAELLQDTDALSKKVEATRREFQENGPFPGEFGHAEAMESLASYREQVQALKDRNSELSTGLKVFAIAHPPYKDIEEMDEDLDWLDKLWGLANEFETKYETWRGTVFNDIQTDELEEEAGSRLKKLGKLQRLCKGKDWPMMEFYKKRISTFKAVMPLILDLKEPAMRDRHWKNLMDTVGKTFDPASADFTLGSMIELQIDAYAEKVADISQSASQELKIEKKIAEISEMWTPTEDSGIPPAPTATLDIGDYKTGGHHVLQGTDDLFAALEENQVTLATMKAPRFVKVFAVEVDLWEKALSMILEVVEMVLTVQRQWMYLENIFKGEEIARQLPEETRKFDAINANWLDIMNTMQADPNARKACHRDGLLKLLTGMNEELEKIQKALDAYLETKRQVFPRFYFVSNDDLLEILGQSKNPKAVQVHLLKCFDNIKSLELEEPLSKSRSSQAIGMYSADGEYVHFMKPVVLDGQVEVWLGKVEQEMSSTLRILMGQCRIAHKKTKRDKWINDWAGQLVIAISQLSWTADTIKSINGGGKKEKVSAKKVLNSMRKKQMSMLKKLTIAIRAVKNKAR